MVSPLVRVRFVQIDFSRASLFTCRKVAAVADASLFWMYDTGRFCFSTSARKILRVWRLRNTVPCYCAKLFDMLQLVITWGLWILYSAVPTKPNYLQIVPLVSRTCTSKLNVAEVQYKSHHCPDVGHVLVWKVQDFHGPSYLAKKVCISEGAPIAVIGWVASYTVALGDRWK